MAATVIPIADIATMVGFADQSHFTKAFRRVTALPLDIGELMAELNRAAMCRPRVMVGRR